MPLDIDLGKIADETNDYVSGAGAPRQRPNQSRKERAINPGMKIVPLRSFGNNTFSGHLPHPDEKLNSKRLRSISSSLPSPPQSPSGSVCSPGQAFHNLSLSDDEGDPLGLGACSPSRRSRLRVTKVSPVQRELSSGRLSPDGAGSPSEGRSSRDTSPLVIDRHELEPGRPHHSRHLSQSTTPTASTRTLYKIPVNIRASSQSQLSYYGRDAGGDAPRPTPFRSVSFETKGPLRTVPSFGRRSLPAALRLDPNGVHSTSQGLQWRPQVAPQPVGGEGHVKQGVVAGRASRARCDPGQPRQPRVSLGHDDDSDE